MMVYCGIFPLHLTSSEWLKVPASELETQIFSQWKSLKLPFVGSCEDPLNQRTKLVTSLFTVICFHGELQTLITFHIRSHFQKWRDVSEILMIKALKPTRLFWWGIRAWGRVGT